MNDRGVIFVRSDEYIVWRVRLEIEDFFFEMDRVFFVVLGYCV